ncbi:carbamoyltransferase HypF [Streptomyces sp. SID5468]|uniref:carbamoyltransferase HypF n=1 Tax=Streptomyces sp. SID5468 TaxID=2690295 RepID=UPI000A663FAA|nr:carbamoyltransferase HypF [Streptantibioticus cattleyicolor]MYS62344.1 carbamoyltransferase HypF [Streptomyces sp. SID5468]
MARRTQGTLTAPGDQGAVRHRVVVRGIVQGVGFRPFVHGLAGELGLAGYVINNAGGVVAEVEGDPGRVHVFCRRISADAPPRAVIHSVSHMRVPPLGGTDFTIRPSEKGPGRTLVPADTAPCPACLAELTAPGDRRYRHPFIACAHCGPRFTIVTALPYDRAATTMAPFPMCGRCAAEYADPADRRFHAQPVACPDCGPALHLTAPRRPAPLHGDQALAEARRLLTAGAVLAVKGLGGYQLVCDATDEGAVAALRSRKGHGTRPFAVMAADLETAAALAPAGEEERALLCDPRHPVVLLRRAAVPGPGAGQRPTPADAVCPGGPDIGVTLPHTPLHHLLFGLPGDPPGPRLLVVTGGNRPGEPPVTDDTEARDRLDGIADAWLWHDRGIRVPCDDSVVRVRPDGEPQPLRRSRGYVPEPVELPYAVPPSLAVGGADDTTFCLAQGRTAWLSPHLGDLARPAAAAAFARTLDHLAALTGVRPRILAADRDPGDLAARWAREHAEGRPLHLVQHHHAHVAAAMADAGLDGTAPVIGVVLDGGGHGDDGALWGGEVLLADYDGYRRAAHLAYLPLPAAARGNSPAPYRTALAHLRAAGLTWEPWLPRAADQPADEPDAADTGEVSTSSMGLLFDAVAALLGLRPDDGHPAAVLEACALPAMADEGDHAYAFGHRADGVLDPAPVLRSLVADLRTGTPAATVAARFHHAVAHAVRTACRRVREADGVTTVVLTGDLFADALLEEGCHRALRADGFTVLRHRQVPCGDGGLALGRLMVATRLRARPAGATGTGTGARGGTSRGRSPG